jgi:hypothetical protein
MKTKPIILISIAMFMAVFFLLRCKSSKVSVKDDGVTQFLEAFKRHIDSGNKDSLMTCFSVNQKNPGLEKLVNILINQIGTDGTKMKISLNIKDALLSPGAQTITTAKIPITLRYGELASQQTNLNLKVSKVGEHQYKISDVDGRLFFTQLIAYQNFVKTNTLDDNDIYSPITLKAFATAEQLKAKYDSVIWFAHVKKQTYFYVVKGKWDFYGNLDDSAKPYQMGLVGPNQKEIVPLEYDLIHNIGDAFENIVEVEQRGKKGFINLQGIIVVPVAYDHIYLVKDAEHLAALKKGDDFYWLKKDFSISEKVEIKISEILPILKLAGSFTISDFGAPDNITEFNSREMHGSIYIPPSYLAEMKLMPVIQCFKNPTRKMVEFFDASTNYIVNQNTAQDNSDNWFTATFYNIRDYFLGGRAEFYDKKDVVIVDKRKNKIFAADIRTSVDETDDIIVDPACDISNIRALNDSLFEVKTGGSFYTQLYDSTTVIESGILYHYFMVENDKLVELPNHRAFGYTKYVKMDDSYLNSCYVLSASSVTGSEVKKKSIKQLTPEMLRYIKNEIYADYRYQFKDKRWKNVFSYITGDYENGYGEKVPVNANVDDSLTLIDKYNVNFIDQKLKALKQHPTLAVK